MKTLPEQWKQQQKQQLEHTIRFYGSQAALAKTLSVEPQVVSNWMNRGRMSATMAEKLEELSNGKFSKRKMRPDVIKWWSE